MSYTGSKNGSGIYQRIINLIPPHRVYIEPFVGSGTIFFKKKPALESIVIDKDVIVLKKYSYYDVPGTTVINGDAISFLKRYRFVGDEFVYCDPPYVLSTRKHKKLYRYEMTDTQHRQLAHTLLKIRAAVMISGYRNNIYDVAFLNLKRIDFKNMTQGGLKDESIWLNYKPPAIPAELTYLGKDFRERERIKRKKIRWANKLAKLPLAEQKAILEILLGPAPQEATMTADIATINERRHRT